MNFNQLNLNLNRFISFVTNRRFLPNIGSIPPSKVITYLPVIRIAISDSTWVDDLNHCIYVV